MSEGRIPIAKNWFSGRCNCHFGAHEFVGMLLRVPSTLYEEEIWAEDWFHNPSDTYYYLWMLEGLKNTEGRFSNDIQSTKFATAYVDDIIVRSAKQQDHISDLQETFTNFQRAGLKLNPEKCAFGVKMGKFVGCLVSTKGIEANPKRIKAILRMEPPKSRKEAQRLPGRLASLNKFISRSAERSLSFFKVLKLAEVFQWGPLATSHRRIEGLSNKANNTFSSFARGSSVTLCISFVINCKCCLGSRSSKRRCEKANACLLRIQSIDPI